MTKAELIDRVFSRKDLARDLTRKAVSRIVEAVFTEVGDYFIRTRVGRNGPVKLTFPGFGTFAKRRRNPRTVKNPQNGEPITIPARSTITFSLSKELRSLMEVEEQPRRR